MLVKITDKCSMGCIHCLSDCTEEGKHMTLDKFKDVLGFLSLLFSSNLDPIIISGGEPFEHPEIKQFLDCLIDDYLSIIPVSMAIVTTNGEYLSNHPEFSEYIAKRSKRIKFQVVIDDRFYPVHVDEESLKKQSNVELCYGVVSIYPQGRALKNKIPYARKSSSCFNVRAVTKQIGLYDSTFDKMRMNLISRGQSFCSPHIDIDGKIKLGESRLCPVCSNIYKSTKEIAEDIMNFKCHQCDFINNNLPPEYRKFVE